MEDFLNRLLLFMLAGVVGLVIGGVLLFIRIRRNARNWPSDERKQHILSQIHDWKLRGLGYTQRLELLLQQGLRKDVADALLGEAERIEQKQ